MTQGTERDTGHLTIKFLRAAIKKKRSRLGRAYATLVGAGADKELLFRDLCNVFANPPRGHTKFLKGMENKTAKRFPGRIRAFAEQIETANTGSLFYELILKTMESAKNKSINPWNLGSARETLQAFEHIPKVLRAYAQFVAFAIQQKPKDMTANQHLVAILIANVVRSSGGAHFSKIEKLLDALFDAKGTDSPYDQRTLRRIYVRARESRRPLIVSPDYLK